MIDAKDDWSRQLFRKIWKSVAPRPVYSSSTEKNPAGGRGLANRRSIISDHGMRCDKSRTKVTTARSAGRALMPDTRFAR